MPRLIVPSSGGGTKLKVLEAMAAGTPVLAYARGSMPELVKHGETGFLVDSEDQMVEMIHRLGSLDRAHCRAWIAEHFSVEQMVDCYEQLYWKAASGHWPGKVI